MKATRSLIALTLMLAACGIDDGNGSAGPTTTTTPVQTTESNEGGFGPPSQAPGEFSLGPGRPVVGSLRLGETGCWFADINGTQRLVVFPVGFTLNPETGSELLDPAGTVYGDGDRFDATASILRGDEIPGRTDGKWGNYMAFCQPELDELLVLNDLVHEFDPSSLSTREMVELLENASFTEHFPCGRGWATSTADQRVGIVIYEADFDLPTADRIELPDTDWNASVLIGKNLFSEHCNDAIEDWIALPTITVQWPLTAGTIIITDPIPGYDEDPARVSAALDGGQVIVGDAPISLPKVELDNTGFNFFAG